MGYYKFLVGTLFLWTQIHTCCHPSNLRAPWPSTSPTGSTFRFTQPHDKWHYCGWVSWCGIKQQSHQPQYGHCSRNESAKNSHIHFWTSNESSGNSRGTTSGDWNKREKCSSSKATATCKTVLSLTSMSSSTSVLYSPSSIRGRINLPHTLLNFQWEQRQFSQKFPIVVYGALFWWSTESVNLGP